MERTRIEDDGASIPLAEVLSAFSYALDMTDGQPEGHSIRCSWIGVQLARAHGVEGAALRDIYYAVLLKDLGCSANAVRVSEIYRCDDHAFKRDFKLVDGSMGELFKFVLTHTGRRDGFLKRSRALARAVARGTEDNHELITTRCMQGAAIARRLRFSEDVCNAIRFLDEHWDGSGQPTGMAGENIPLGARVALLAQVADVFFHTHGPDQARTEIAARSGGWFDPRLCEAFERISAKPAFWQRLAADDLPQRLTAIESDLDSVDVDEDYLDDIAAAFGAVIDAKSPYTAGHSERVGEITDRIAAKLGMADAPRRGLVRAARLHDIGKLGVSSRILEKPGRLDADEWHAMQGHADLTRRILGRISALGNIADFASAHHERLDGHGYPQGLSGDQIPLTTRIITVSDFFDALTSHRPYRPALSREEALAIMKDHVGSALDPHCYEALREVA